MRKLVYEVKETKETVTTLKEAKELRNKGFTVKETLYNIPEEVNRPSVTPYVTVKNELVRQYA